MTNVMPEGEAIRNAVKWVSASCQGEPAVPLKKAIQQAILRFDLSPLEADFLLRFYQKDDTGLPSA
jgi:hypothetical protein